LYERKNYNKYFFFPYLIRYLCLFPLSVFRIHCQFLRSNAANPEICYWFVSAKTRPKLPVSQPLLLLRFIRVRRALQARRALTSHYVEGGRISQFLSESPSACFRHSILSSTALSSKHFTHRGFVVCSTLIARCPSRSTFMADLSPIHFWPTKILCSWDWFPLLSNQRTYRIFLGDP
jgi:hypothetical protein